MKDSLVSVELCLRPPVVLSICNRSEMHCDAYPFQDRYSNFKAASRLAIGLKVGIYKHTLLNSSTCEHVNSSTCEHVHGCSLIDANRVCGMMPQQHTYFKQSILQLY